METRTYTDRFELGRQAAAYTAQLLNRAIAEKGNARLMLSAGETQLETHFALMARKDVPWEKVELFFFDSWDQIKFFRADRIVHYNERLIPDFPKDHSCSFRKYMIEHVKKVYFLDGAAENPEGLRTALAAAPIDVGLIGMCEKAHPVFYEENPGTEPYIPLDLSGGEKRRQLEEGWFENPCGRPEVPVSVSPRQLLGSGNLIVCAPTGSYSKEALDRTLGALRAHPVLTLFTDHKEAEEE